MPTTTQMLADYPDILLQVLAEMRGAFLDGVDNRRQALDLLASQLTEPTSILMAYQEALDFHPQAQDALDLLLESAGEVGEAQFVREFGGIRQMGPAKLEREAPWLHPESVAEMLYYAGLLGRGYKGAGQQAQTVIYIPSDVLPWLPQPAKPAIEGGLPVVPTLAPPASRLMVADDGLLEDAGTLLGFLHTDQLRLEASGPHPEDVARLAERFRIPYLDAPEFQVRLDLLLHLANRLGWLRRGENKEGAPVVQLTGNRVRAFLEQTRAEQRFSLWDAWRQSPEWNDLCRTPALECVESGSWRNDPTQSRQAILRLLGQLQPGVWYNQSDVIQAIQEVEPDFQRPTGHYDTWYIRSTSTQAFLKGFEHWNEVEGALLRFLFAGPLHWLRAVDLAEPSAGDDMQICLTPWGLSWLGQDAAPPNETPRHPYQVGEDFTVTLPADTPLYDRFRVERFTQWQASYPRYVYRITQRSLARAVEEGLTAAKLLDFLKQHTRSIPPKVAGALEKVGRK